MTVTYTKKASLTLGQNRIYAWEGGTCALQGQCGSEVRFVRNQCVLTVSRYVGSRVELQVSRLVLQVLCSVSCTPSLVSVCVLKKCANCLLTWAVWKALDQELC